MTTVINDVVPMHAFAGQIMGTSGLRKKVSEVKQPGYLEAFVQAIFNTLIDNVRVERKATSIAGNELHGITLVVSGDGRYYNRQAVAIIIRMARANGVARVIVGVDYLMSTPAVSAIVRQRKAFGAIILTASHNPGGPDGDFGIKYNMSNGGPAPESVTKEIEKAARAITSYRIGREELIINPAIIGNTSYGDLIVEVIDATEEYASLMATIFDFDALRSLIARPNFSMVYDSMHGVAGPFARRVLVDKLKAKPDVLLNGIPKEDFGGGHPDPNLTYAPELVARMGLPVAAGSHVTSHGSNDKDHKHDAPTPDFGAAADGDADRNMILGKQFFVTPSDSVAIIAANAQVAIPYFAASRGGIKGIARSMPTSAALDRVATELKLSLYEVPTGWKFFGNLMDAGRLSICGEESFGTGSDHVREKDGLWAVLSWLSIIEYRNRGRASGADLVSVRDIVLDHWKTYGRNYYTRYDYEGVETKQGDDFMAKLRALTASITSSSSDTKYGLYTVKTADDFSYTDPVDGSVSAKQGIRIIFTDGSRIIFRLSGTGSSGATIRVYIEQYQAAPAATATDLSLLLRTPEEALAPLIAIALDVSDLQKMTGRTQPTVIT